MVEGYRATLRTQKQYIEQKLDKLDLECESGSYLEWEQHPEEQQKVVDKVNSIMQEQNEDVVYTKETLPDFWYNRIAAAEIMKIVKPLIDKVLHIKSMQDYITEIVQDRISRGCIDVLWTTGTGWVTHLHKPKIKKVQKDRNFALSEDDDNVRFTRTLPIVEPNKVNKIKLVNSTPACFVHSHEAAVMTKTIGVAYEHGIDQIATIHDCYQTLPKNINLLKQLNWEQNKEYYNNHNWMEQLRFDAEAYDVSQFKLGSLVLDQRSPYFLC